MSTQKPPHPPAVITGETRRSGVPAWDWAHRNRHWTLPPALIPLFAAAGFALAAWRQHTGAIVAGTAATLAVWFFAPAKWDRPAEQWYARLSAIAAGGWLSAASFTGVTWTMSAVLTGMILTWGAFWWHHKRPRARDGDAAIIAEWNAWWQHHARSWSLHGSAVTGITSKGTMETLRVQLWAGRQTVRQVTDAAELIESALAGYVRPGMIRVDRDPGNPSQALVRLKREDPLLVPSGWHPGMAISTVTEPAPVGFTETGEIIRVSLLSNWFIVGKTRSGKSNELSVMLAEITGCDDALVWLVDMKGGRAARPWMPAVDWCAVTTGEAEIMFTVLAGEIKARATHADDSEEQLRPTREVPAIFLVIDEAYEVTSVSAGVAWLASRLAVIASQGLGVAVEVIVATQYGALDESVRTEQTRSNLINRMCFAVAHSSHGAFALGDYQKLDASRLREKGSFYMQLGPDASSSPGRGFRLDHPLARQVAERHGAMPRLPLRLYASQHQDAYDARWSRLPQPFWRSAPQTAELSPSPEVSPAAVAEHGSDATAREMAERIEREIAATPDSDPSRLRMPTDEQVRGEMGRRKLRFARALTAAPEAGISPDRLVTASGLSRSWVQQQLRDLAGRGAVIRLGRGAYRAAPGVSVWDEMEAIRGAEDALLARSA